MGPGRSDCALDGGSTRSEEHTVPPASFISFCTVLFLFVVCWIVLSGLMGDRMGLSSLGCTSRTYGGSLGL